jgi:hypothetical protein
MTTCQLAMNAITYVAERLSLAQPFRNAERLDLDD